MRGASTWQRQASTFGGGAQQLGIKLTDAELGSELCEAGADRVKYAKLCFDDGAVWTNKLAIEDANAYAI